MFCTRSVDIPSESFSNTLDLRLISCLISWYLYRCNEFFYSSRVPNVAKRTIWEQCKKKYILRTDRPATGDRRPATGDQRPTTDDRPTSHLAHIGEISNGHISARGRPIHFMFGSTVVRIWVNGIRWLMALTLVDSWFSDFYMILDDSYVYV